MIRELFSQIQEYLSDEENISLILCSKEIYDQKALIKFKSEYNFIKIYDRWCLPRIKNITIDDHIESNAFDDQIKLILFSSNHESLVANNSYIEWVTHDQIKIRLLFYLYNWIIKLCIRYECFHFAAKLLMLDPRIKLADDRSKDYALLSAIERNCFNIVVLLLDKDIHAITLDRALIAASNVPDIDMRIIKLIIDSCLLIEHYGCKLMYNAAKNGNLELVKLFMEKIDVIGEEQCGLVSIALFNGHDEVAKLLIENNFDIKGLSNDPLVIAAKKNNLFMIKLLISYGANVNDQAMRVMKGPVVNGHIEALKLLIKKNIDINSIKNSDIISAWENGHKHIVKFIMEKKLKF